MLTHNWEHKEKARATDLFDVYVHEWVGEGSS